MGEVTNLVRDYGDLKVWQRGRVLVKEIYKLSKYFPSEERYGLSAQMRRAVVSIPSNIAEGHSRGTKEYSHFVSIALGSVAELETQLILAQDLEYVSSIDELMNELIELRKILTSLRKKLLLKNVG